MGRSFPALAARRCWPTGPAVSTCFGICTPSGLPVSPRFPPNELRSPFTRETQTAITTAGTSVRRTRLNDLARHDGLIGLGEPQVSGPAPAPAPSRGLGCLATHAARAGGAPADQTGGRPAARPARSSATAQRPAGHPRAVTTSEQIASYYDQADEPMADYLTALGWTHQPPHSPQPPGPAERTNRHPPASGGHKQ